MSVALDMPYSSTNRVLRQLPGTVLYAMRPFLTRVRLVFEQVLIEAGGVTEHVFFPELGVVSLMADTTNSRSGMQMAMIGRDGMVGAPALLWPTALSFVTAITQIPGPALRISVADLRRLFDQHAALRDTCMQSIQSLTTQTMQNAVYIAQRSLVDRLIRWLLMTGDQVDGGELLITHDTLSRLLGTRRASVTIIAAALEEEGLIRASRGRITILDRARLEQRAGTARGTRHIKPHTDSTEPASLSLSM